MFQVKTILLFVSFHCCPVNLAAMSMIEMVHSVFRCKMATHLPKTVHLRHRCQIHWTAVKRNEKKYRFHLEHLSTTVYKEASAQTINRFVFQGYIYGYGVQRHFQQNFGYMVAVSLLVEETRVTAVQ
jgi:hypothetical protein